MYLYRRRDELFKTSDKILKIASLLTGNPAAWFEPTFKDFVNYTENNKENETNRIFESYKNFENKFYFMYENLNEKRVIIQKFLKFR